MTTPIFVHLSGLCTARQRSYIIYGLGPYSTGRNDTMIQGCDSVILADTCTGDYKVPLRTVHAESDQLICNNNNNYHNARFVASDQCCK